METEVVWALLGVLVALLGVAVTIIAMQRRNGKNGNPNFETLEVLIQQQITLQEKSLDKLDALIVSMTTIETTVQFCPTVQATRRGQ